MKPQTEPPTPDGSGCRRCYDAWVAGESPGRAVACRGPKPRIGASVSGYQNASGKTGCNRLTAQGKSGFGG
ncbi:hypothetical protein [Dickeya lacustris]|uniref:hypothetical protein n=1 Tax=Dickeya lacustris TaxID=2259638 RepID=UPI0013DD9D9D|nr:hypothetical protein [Dickeya lacustris]